MMAIIIMAVIITVLRFKIAQQFRILIANLMMVIIFILPVIIRCQSITIIILLLLIIIPIKFINYVILMIIIIEIRFIMIIIIIHYHQEYSKKLSQFKILQAKNQTNKDQYYAFLRNRELTQKKQN